MTNWASGPLEETRLIARPGQTGCAGDPKMISQDKVGTNKAGEIAVTLTAFEWRVLHLIIPESCRSIRDRISEAVAGLDPDDPVGIPLTDRQYRIVTLAGEVMASI